MKIASSGPGKIIVDNLRTDARDKAQAKIASAELPFEYSLLLAQYYGYIHLLKAGQLDKDEELPAELQEIMQKAMETGKAIIRRTEAYFPPEFRRNSCNY